MFSKNVKTKSAQLFEGWRMVFFIHLSGEKYLSMFRCKALSGRQTVPESRKRVQENQLEQGASWAGKFLL